MLDAQGKPRADLFRWDGLHMNAKGFALWTSIIRPVLLERFAVAESGDAAFETCPEAGEGARRGMLCLPTNAS